MFKAPSFSLSPKDQNKKIGNQIIIYGSDSVYQDDVPELQFPKDLSQSSSLFRIRRFMHMKKSSRQSALKVAIFLEYENQ